jgi:hypothetical protein
MKESLDSGKEDVRKQPGRDLGEPAENRPPQETETATGSSANCECPPGCVGLPCCT